MNILLFLHSIMENTIEVAEKTLLCYYFNKSDSMKVCRKNKL